MFAESNTALSAAVLSIANASARHSWLIEAANKRFVLNPTLNMQFVCGGVALHYHTMRTQRSVLRQSKEKLNVTFSAEHECHLLQKSQKVGMVHVAVSHTFGGLATSANGQ
jgi:hypothetical protein